MTRAEALALAKQILFNTPMTRAIIADIKAKTRRLVKGLPDCRFIDLEIDPEVCFDGDLDKTKTLKGLWATFESYGDSFEEFPMRKARYSPGDLLYVREAWNSVPLWRGTQKVGEHYLYRADDYGDNPHNRWRPSIHMPKAAARIFLRVTEVRVERLQEITLDDIRREGVCSSPNYTPEITEGEDLWFEFQNVWENTLAPAERGAYGWNSNPYVWVITFERVEVD